MMTRKDFVLVAQTISHIKNVDKRKEMAELNATAFARSNPRFDRSKFLAACNVKE